MKKRLTESEILKLYPPELYTMIRGGPRRNEHVRQVEDELGGKLVTDKEPSLLLALDNYLAEARYKLDHYPDYIAIPSEPMTLFVPIPFEVYFHDITINAWHKPAWFRIQKRFVTPSLKWNDSQHKDNK
jgi:hypothetical protein